MRNIIQRFNEMPWGMRIGAALSTVFTVNWCAATFLQLTGQPPGQWSSSFGIGGVEFGPGQLVTVPVVLFLIGIVIAFLLERPWSRDLVVSFWVIVSAMLLGAAVFGGQGPGAVISTVLVLSPIIAVTLWYFYGKEEVVLYFRRISARDIDRRTSRHNA